MHKYCSNPLETVLSRVENAKKTGEGKWRCRCPAHDSKPHSRTLSIGIGHSGQVLVHCFGGCSTQDVLGALGLQHRDLYPPQQQTSSRVHEESRTRKALSRELFLLHIAVTDRYLGREISHPDRIRERQAVERIRALLDRFYPVTKSKKSA